MRYLNWILFFGMFSSAFNAGAEERLNGRWKQVDGSTMMALRSNAPHFWAWAAKHDNLIPSNWLDSIVFVTGDPHHENFSHVNIGGKRIYVPNDLDDTGEAPAILEFFKFLSVSRSVQEDPEKLSTEFLAQAYLEGLNGKKFSGDFPRFLEEDRDVTLDRLNKDELADVERRYSKGQFDDQLTRAEARDFDQLEKQYFQKNLPKGWEVLARAVHAKAERDGTNGLPRFWYLLRDQQGDKHIVEFKEQAQSSVGLYQKQNGRDCERLLYSLKTYWGTRLPPLFKVIDAGDRFFLMRPKLPNYLNFSVDEFRDKKKKFAELSAYISYKLGRWHGEQLGPKKIDRLNLDSKSLSETADKYVSAYLKDVKREQR